MAEKDYNNLPLGELKEILKKKRQINKVKYKELREIIEKELLIRKIRKVEKLNEKLKNGGDIKIQIGDKNLTPFEVKIFLCDSDSDSDSETEK